MSDRDDDFRRLVPMLPGWTVSEPDGNLVKSLRAFRRADYASFGLPAPDAPLHAHLAFVGQIAETLPDWRMSIQNHEHDGAEEWGVHFEARTGGLHAWANESDLAWAAVTAASEAKGGAT